MTKPKKQRAPLPLVGDIDQPVFEILVGPRGTKAARRYSIYANGRVEGFGDDVAVINRIPGLLERVVRELGNAQREIADRLRRAHGG